MLVDGLSQLRPHVVDSVDPTDGRQRLRWCTLIARFRDPTVQKSERSWSSLQTILIVRTTFLTEMQGSLQIFGTPQNQNVVQDDLKQVVWKLSIILKTASQKTLQALQTPLRRDSISGSLSRIRSPLVLLVDSEHILDVRHCSSAF